MKQLYALLIFLISVGMYGQALDGLSTEKLLDSTLALQRAQQLIKANQLLDEAHTRIHDSSSLEVQYKYKLAVSIHRFDNRTLPGALQAATEALELATTMGDSSKVARTSSVMGNIHGLMGAHHTAMKYFERAEKHYQKEKGKHYYEVLMNKSYAYSGLNEYTEALNLLSISRTYFAKIGDYHHLAITENNIGEIYRRNINDNKKARQHYYRAATANTRIDNKIGLAQNHHNLATMFLDNNQADSAMPHALKSKRLKEEFGESGQLVTANYIIASTYQAMGKTSKAIEYHQLSLRQSKANNIMLGIFHNSLELAEIYFENKQYGKSTSHLSEALELAEDVGEIDLQVSAYTGLYEVAKAQGNYAEALGYFEAKQLLSDSIAGLMASQNLDEVRTRYEADLAEAENMMLREKEKMQRVKLKSQQQLIYLSVGSAILLLLGGLWLAHALRTRNKALASEKATRKELADHNEKLRLSEKELAESNDLKNKILSVLGHDLRTPLSGLSALLSTMSAVEVTRDELKELLGMLHKEVDHSLTMLHQILLWSRMEMNEMGIKPQPIDMSEMAEEVIAAYDINLRAKNLKIVKRVEDDAVIQADENQVRSIMGNLLSNAIKFSEEGAKIEIEVESFKTTTTLSIIDHGAGISDTALELINNRDKLSSGEGTSGELGTGIGLRIVQDFVRAHNGKLIFASKKDTGTTVQVVIPNNFRQHEVSENETGELVL